MFSELNFVHSTKNQNKRFHEYFFSKNYLFTEYTFLESEEFISDSTSIRIPIQNESELQTSTQFFLKHSKTIQEKLMTVGGPFWKGSYFVMLNLLIDICNFYVMQALEGVKLDIETMISILKETRQYEWLQTSKSKRQSAQLIYQSYSTYKYKRYNIFTAFLDITLLTNKNPDVLYTILDAYDFQCYDEADIKSNIDKSSMFFQFHKMWTKTDEQIDRKLNWFNIQQIPNDPDIYEQLVFDKQYKKMLAICMVKNWKGIICLINNPHLDTVVEYQSLQLLSDAKALESNKYNSFKQKISRLVVLPFEPLMQTQQQTNDYLKCLVDSVLENVAQSEHIKRKDKLTFAFNYVRHLEELHECVCNGGQSKTEFINYVIANERNIIYFFILILQSRRILLDAIQENEDVDQQVTENLIKIEKINLSILESFTQSELKYPPLLMFFGVGFQKSDKLTSFLENDFIQIIQGTKSMQTYKGKTISKVQLYDYVKSLQNITYQELDEDHWRVYRMDQIDKLLGYEGWDIQIELLTKLQDEERLRHQNFLCRYIKRLFDGLEIKWSDEKVFDDYSSYFIKIGFYLPKIFARQVNFSKNLQPTQERQTLEMIFKVIFYSDQWGYNEAKKLIAHQDIVVNECMSYQANLSKERNILNQTLPKKSLLQTYFMNLLNFRYDHSFPQIQKLIFDVCADAQNCLFAFVKQNQFFSNINCSNLIKKLNQLSINSVDERNIRYGFLDFFYSMDPLQMIDVLENFLRGQSSFEYPDNIDSFYWLRLYDTFDISHIIDQDSLNHLKFFLCLNFSVPGRKEDFKYILAILRRFVEYLSVSDLDEAQLMKIFKFVARVLQYAHEDTQENTNDVEQFKQNVFKLQLQENQELDIKSPLKLEQNLQKLYEIVKLISQKGTPLLSQDQKFRPQVYFMLFLLLSNVSKNDQKNKYNILGLIVQGDQVPKDIQLNYQWVKNNQEFNSSKRIVSDSQVLNVTEVKSLGELRWFAANLLFWSDMTTISQLQSLYYRALLKSNLWETNFLEVLTIIVDLDFDAKNIPHFKIIENQRQSVLNRLTERLKIEYQKSNEIHRGKLLKIIFHIYQKGNHLFEGIDIKPVIYDIIKPWLSYDQFSKIFNKEKAQISFKLALEEESASYVLESLRREIKKARADDKYKQLTQEILNPLKNFYDEQVVLLSKKSKVAVENILKVFFVLCGAFQTFVHQSNMQKAIQQLYNRVDSMVDQTAVNEILDLTSQILLVFRATRHNNLLLGEEMTFQAKDNKYSEKQKIASYEFFLKEIYNNQINLITTIIQGNNSQVSQQLWIWQSKLEISYMPNFNELLDCQRLVNDPVEQKESKPQEKKINRKKKKPIKKKQQRRNPSIQHQEPIIEVEQSVEESMEQSVDVEHHEDQDQSLWDDVNQIIDGHRSQVQEEKITEQKVEIRPEKKQEQKQEENQFEKKEIEENDNLQEDYWEDDESEDDQKVMKKVEESDSPREYEAKMWQPSKLDELIKDAQAGENELRDLSDGHDNGDNEEDMDEEEDDHEDDPADDDGNEEDMDENSSKCQEGKALEIKEDLHKALFQSEPGKKFLLLRELYHDFGLNNQVVEQQQIVIQMKDILRSLKERQRCYLSYLLDHSLRGEIEMQSYPSFLDQVRRFHGIIERQSDQVSNSSRSMSEQDEEESHNSMEVASEEFSEGDIERSESGRSDGSIEARPTQSTKYHQIELLSSVQDVFSDESAHKEDILVQIHIDRIMGSRLMQYCILQTNQYNSDPEADRALTSQPIIYLKLKLFSLIIENIEKDPIKPIKDKVLQDKLYRAYLKRLKEILIYFFKICPLSIYTILKTFEQIEKKENTELFNILLNFLKEVNSQGSNELQNLISKIFNLSLEEISQVSTACDFKLNLTKPPLEILLSNSQLIPKNESLLNYIVKLLEKWPQIQLTENSLSLIINNLIVSEASSGDQRKYLQIIKNCVGVRKQAYSLFASVLKRFSSLFDALRKGYDSGSLQMSQIEAWIINDDGVYDFVLKRQSKIFWTLIQDEPSWEGNVPSNVVELYEQFFGICESLEHLRQNDFQMIDLDDEEATQNDSLSRVADSLKVYFRHLCCMIKKETIKENQSQTTQILNRLLSLKKISKFFCNQDSSYIGVYHQVLRSIDTELAQQYLMVENVLKFKWMSLQKQTKQYLGENDVVYIYVKREKEVDSLIYNILYDSSVGGFLDASLGIFYLDWETQFIKEKGTDQGGVSQDFLTLVIKCLNASGLFLHTEEFQRAYPNSAAKAIPDHKSAYIIYGGLIAKSIMDGYIVGVGLANFVLKQLYGIRTMTMEDLLEYDSSIHSSLKWILENDVEALGLTFSVDEQFVGILIEHELKENGFDIPVTEENKQEYVNLLIKHYLCDRIQDQIDSLKLGFDLLFPKSTKQIVNWKDLQPFIEGESFISIDEMKKNITFLDFHDMPNLVNWFWRYMSELNQKELSEFLYFVTSSYRLPKGGFNNSKLTIQWVSQAGALPVSHTCSNQLDLSKYETYEEMRDKLTLAIQNGHGFGTA